MQAVPPGGGVLSQAVTSLPAQPPPPGFWQMVLDFLKVSRCVACARWDEVMNLEVTGVDDRTEEVCELTSLVIELLSLRDQRKHFYMEYSLKKLTQV